MAEADPIAVDPTANLAVDVDVEAEEAVEVDDSPEDEGVISAGEVEEDPSDSNPDEPSSVRSQ